MDLSRYADLFRTEARDHLVAIDEALTRLADGDAMEAIASLFRSVHTIKGMAGAMGYAAVEQVAHNFESLLAALRSAERQPDAATITLCIDASDALASHVDVAVDASSALDAPAPASPALLTRLADAAAAWQDADTNGAANPATVRGRSDLHDHGDVFPVLDLMPTALHDAAPVVTATRARVLTVSLTDDAPLKSVRAQLVIARLEALGTVQHVEPAPHTWTEHFDGRFRVALSTTHVDDALLTAVRSAGDIARVDVGAPSQASAATAGIKQVRIDLRRLDTLLDLMGELVITRDRLVRSADGTTDRDLAAAVLDTSRLVSALQDEVLQARMVPIGQVFDRFPRLVRDVARDLDKEVTLHVEGREIELDRSMLDAVGDPIVHLLRNAVDHGIEGADARRAAGKHPTGRLILRAVRDRSAIVIEVEDDGAGIDARRVLAQAQSRGVLGADVTALGDDELIRVLAMPGFSTAASVTAISGRGVGVDVVTTRVRALGGTLELRTEPGRGSTFTMRLPLTLAIVRALLVQVADAVYAIPAAHVVEAVEFDDATCLTLRGEETVSLRDDILPLVRLRRLFGAPASDDAGTQLVIVESSGRRIACKVDAVVGQQDVVVKPVDGVRGAQALFSGATILGDGNPALIVDVGGLAA